nr:hypothetical protein [Tanacetum cinerariifolium]
MTKHKSISKREGSPYYLVKDDGMLYILKFVNKSDKYQVYEKPIPDTLLTKNIRITNAYQMYYKYAMGLIPPKMGRGKAVMEDKAVVSPKKITNPKMKPAKETQATKEPATPKNATTSSKKKLIKKNLVISDEPDVSEGELENRPVSRKIRTLRAVVIQETPSVPVKKTQESSWKLKGIVMLSKVEKVELDTQKAIKPEVPDEQTGKSHVSTEEVGISSKVPNEILYDDEAQSNDDDWGSTYEETNKDKIEDDDEDDVSKEEEDEEESVSKEENVDQESKEESDDGNRSFDITNIDGERTESKFDNHEISIEGKTVAEIEEDEIANSRHEEDNTK